MLAAMTGLATVPAAGFELFGMKFFEDESDADAVIADPQPYTIEVHVPGEGDVESTVRNASSLVGGADEPASGAAGLLASARGDYKRILAALYDVGYFVV